MCRRGRALSGAVVALEPFLVATAVADPHDLIAFVSGWAVVVSAEHAGDMNCHGSNCSPHRTGCQLSVTQWPGIAYRHGSRPGLREPLRVSRNPAAGEARVTRVLRRDGHTEPDTRGSSRQANVLLRMSAPSGARTLSRVVLVGGARVWGLPFVAARRVRPGEALHGRSHSSRIGASRRCARRAGNAAVVTLVAVTAFVFSGCDGGSEPSRRQRDVRCHRHAGMQRTSRPPAVIVPTVAAISTAFPAPGTGALKPAVSRRSRPR